MAWSLALQDRFLAVMAEIDYGRDVHRPPKDLADHVIARDRTCRFPHCQRQACRCDLDRGDGLVLLSVAV